MANFPKGLKEHQITALKAGRGVLIDGRIQTMESLGLGTGEGGGVAIDTGRKLQAAEDRIASLEAELETARKGEANAVRVTGTDPKGK